MEQATLPSACFLQIVQPSVHSRQFGLSSAKAAIAFGATGGGGMSALTGETAAQSDSMSDYGAKLHDCPTFSFL